ncbi:MAG: glycosyltransferase family 2 protein [Patescibacteria group bacterium]
MPLKIGSIVIVNWNGKADTLNCLASLAKLTTYDLRLTTIVVDNGSTDGSVGAIRKKFPRVEVVETGKNLGFCGGNNVGIRRALEAGADFVWLLNNDTLVDSGALSLANVFQDTKIGVAGSKIYFAKGHEYHKDRYTKDEQGNVIWYAGGLIDWDNMYASHRGVDEVDHGQFDEMAETPFVTGCSMMVQSKVFERIGFLDEQFYLYLEDVDFCLRAARAGFAIVYVPTSVVWHINAGSSAPGSELHQYYQTRNRILLGMRYASLRTKIALTREAVRHLWKGKPVVRRAIMDWILCRYGQM